MRACFRYDSAVEDDYFVGVSDCGESVGDDEAGSALSQGYHRGLDVHFGSGVD